MTPRTIDGWEQPRRPQNQRWRYEYNKTISQIDLKISTDEPQNKFEGEITERMSGNRKMNILCDQEGWRSLIPDVTPDGRDYIRPGPEIPAFNNMEELAIFMVAKAGEIEAERNA